MNLSAIKSLIATMVESDLAEMTYGEDGWTLRLVRDHARTTTGQPAPAPPAAAPPLASPPMPEGPPARPALLEAPLAGIVHFRPAPDAPAFIEPGDAVRVGDPLCIIEAMKVFNTVRAEHDGVVAAILVPSGSEVDAGQPLLRLT